MERFYVYGVVGASDMNNAALPSVGLKGNPVMALQCDEVAAIVSPLESERVRSSRADLSAHQEVVEHVAARMTILPLQFGVVMAGQAAVVDEFLVPHRDELAGMVADLTGKAEHRLKATYVGDVALLEVVKGNAAIRRLRDRVGSRAGAAGYHDRIRLGELVAAALETVKAQDARTILERAMRHAASAVVLSASRENVAMHAAFLVDGEALTRFDDDIESLASDLKGRLTFELVGPLAPWDFVSDDFEYHSDSPSPRSMSRSR